jgi:endopolyphosphatase
LEDGTTSKKDLTIPIVPNLGNNDFLPHNIFAGGPNEWTTKFAKVWHKFIPEKQRHAFVQGGWFYTEVIPDRLAVFSLNTMYFYDSNTAVDGCADPSEPGYAHMEWLRVQLQLLRQRGLKAILIGHVPPARSGDKRNWDETCWQKYTLWLLQYRDVVIGSLFGHMNIDHFILQDSHDIDINTMEPNADLRLATRETFTTQSRSTYLMSLREEWSRMPSPSSISMEGWDALDETEKRKMQRSKFWEKIGGRWAERYSVSLVSPSVIPNYFPSLRVIEYNVTGLDNAATWADAMAKEYSSAVDSHPLIEPEITDQGESPTLKIPKPPSSATSPGPAYSNQPLTWLSYTQYFANLTRLNEGVSRSQASSGKRHAKENQDPGMMREELKRTGVPFEFEIEYSTKHDNIYGIKDLTVLNLFKLAGRIAEKHPGKSDLEDMSWPELLNTRPNTPADDADATKKKKKKNKKKKKKKKKNRPQPEFKNEAWYTFLTRAFVGYYDEEDVDEIATRAPR